MLKSKPKTFVLDYVLPVSLPSGILWKCEIDPLRVGMLTQGSESPFVFKRTKYRVTPISRFNLNQASTAPRVTPVGPVARCEPESLWGSGLEQTSHLG